MTKKNRAKVLLILSILCIFVLYTFFVKTKKIPLQLQIEAPVRVVEPSTGTLEKTIKLTGFVDNDSTVTVFPKVAGTLLELKVKTGDSVYAGQVLGKIDSEPYDFQLNQAQAAFTATTAAWERVQNLYSTGSVAQQTYDRAKAEFESAKSQHDMAKLQKEYTKITSPVRGSVLKIHTGQGNTAAQSQPILTIGSSDTVKVNLAVPERYFTLFESKLINESDVIHAEIPVLNDKRIKAQIQTVAPYISPQTRTFEVECTLTNDAAVRAGMFALIYVTADRKKNVPYLPYSALTGGNALWYIEDGKARKIIHTPEFEGDSGFMIPEAFASYRFIIDGQHFLKDGDTVRILQD